MSGWRYMGMRGEGTVWQAWPAWTHGRLDERCRAMAAGRSSALSWWVSRDPRAATIGQTRTVGGLSADCRPTVGRQYNRQSADSTTGSRPTVQRRRRGASWGASCPRAADVHRPRGGHPGPHRTPLPGPRPGLRCVACPRLTRITPNTVSGGSAVSSETNVASAWSAGGRPGSRQTRCLAGQRWARRRMWQVLGAPEANPDHARHDAWRVRGGPDQVMAGDWSAGGQPGSRQARCMALSGSPPYPIGRDRARSAPVGTGQGSQRAGSVAQGAGGGG